MCTAVSLKFENFYFGRTLDLDCSFGQKVVLVPRNFKVNFRCSENLNSHHAIIGMAAVRDNFPLFFDAVNEKGLCMAGLRFANNAYYGDVLPDRTNLAPFEFILWVLCKCSSVKEAKKLLSSLNIADLCFSDELPNTPLHWLIADREESLTVEAVKEGLFLYENKIGVLTNNPPFKTILQEFEKYSNLTATEKKNTNLPPESHSLGLGGLGLPGDFSSKSRFARAAFIKENSYQPKTEETCVSQFFHIMNSVNIPKGCVILADGNPHYTVYTSCMSAEKGVYYYKLYDDQAVRKVNMNSCDLDGDKILSF